MFRTIFILTLLCLLAPLPAQTSAGRVEMPLAEWQQILNQLQATEKQRTDALAASKPVPPVAGVIYSADCEVTPSGSTGKISITYDVETLAAGWSLLPLVDDSLPLESQETNAGRIVHRDGRYVLLTEGPVRAKVRLVLLASALEKTPVELWLAETISTRAKFLANPGQGALEVNGRQLAPGEATALAISSTREKNLSLRLLAAVEKIEVQAEIPGQWQSRAETVVKYEDGRLNFFSRVVLWCGGGNDRQAVLQLPPEAVLLGVGGEDAPTWSNLGDAEKPRILVEWKAAGKRQRVLEIALACEHPDLAKPWPLLAPVADGWTVREEIWAARPLPGLRFVTPGQVPMPAALSAWLRSNLENSSGEVFQASADEKLLVKPVLTLALAGAGIDRAEYLTRLARGGGVLTEARLTITHSGAVSAEFQLRKEARLVSCQVDQIKQAPVDLGDGRFQVNLPTGSQSRVEFTFSEQGPPLQPATGQVRLELPASPLLTNLVEWTIQLPTDLALDAFEGSVVATGGGDGLRFRQEICQQTAPHVVLFYQKKIK